MFKVIETEQDIDDAIRHHIAASKGMFWDAKSDRFLNKDQATMILMGARRVIKNIYFIQADAIQQSKEPNMAHYTASHETPPDGA